VAHELDSALGQLHAYGCELNNGLTNHAPMVAETLHHLGLHNAIQPWVSSELKRCLLRPKHTAPIDTQQWQDALGDANRFSDWADLFNAEISEQGWMATLQTWVPRLAPGFAASAAHGVIRVGHATRALKDQETDARNLELADALASWGSEYLALPVSDSANPKLSPSRSLARVKRVADEAHSPAGSITAAISELSQDPQFAEHFSVLNVNDDPAELTLDIAATFARLFCQSAQSVLGAIVFTHAITGIAAVRNLQPYLANHETKVLLRHAFHTGCALHAVYSSYDYAPPVDEPLPLDAAECIYDALEHGDEHVIKLTEACVTFTEATADTFFLTAAERCRRLVPPRSRQ
jgi:hypothetical protein